MPGEIVFDLGPVREFNEALNELRARWASLHPEIRPRLSRLIWLHPDGGTVVYRSPDTESDHG